MFQLPEEGIIWHILQHKGSLTKENRAVRACLESGRGVMHLPLGV
jgi:hypothetical protein